MSPTSSGPDWAEHDRRHVWHPYTQMQTAPAPVPLTSARGAHLYTADGRRLLDGISSWWVTLHGHGEPAIAEAIARQARELDHAIFAGFTHEPAARLAHEVAERLPGSLDRVFYSDNGSTAVEVGLKMAFQHWYNRGEKGRTRFVAIEDAYHGDTVGTMSPGGVAVFHETFRPLLFEVDRIPHPHSARWNRKEMDLEARSEACLELLDRHLEEHASETAGLVVEPLVQGAGGMLVWPDSSLGRMREICDRHGVLLILDEVFTGFGRTGALFACERGGIQPDIICLSKAITGGFLPLAVTVTHEEIYASFLSEDRSKTFFHGHSYTANPIACAAGLASLELLEKSGLRRIDDISAIHRERVARLADSPRVTDAASVGLISRMRIHETGERGKDSGYLHGIGPRLAAAFLERDILLRPLGDVLYILPPLAMSDAELHGIYDVLEELLETGAV